MGAPNPFTAPPDETVAFLQNQIDTLTRDLATEAGRATAAEEALQVLIDALALPEDLMTRLAAVETAVIAAQTEAGAASAAASTASAAVAAEAATRAINDNTLNTLFLNTQTIANDAAGTANGEELRATAAETALSNRVSHLEDVTDDHDTSIAAAAAAAATANSGVTTEAAARGGADNTIKAKRSVLLDSDGNIQASAKIDGTDVKTLSFTGSVLINPQFAYSYPTPVLSPTSKSFTPTLELTTEEPAAGLTRRYTKGGSSPTDASPQWPDNGATPITIDKTMTVIIQDFNADGVAVSDKFIGHYTLLDAGVADKDCAAVSITPVIGTPNRSACTVKFGCPTMGAVIHYALDDDTLGLPGGSAGTTWTPGVSANVVVNLDHVVYAYATASGFNDSEPRNFDNYDGTPGGL